MLNNDFISEPKDEAYGLVYFIGQGDSGPIKIGFTTHNDVRSRLRQLQTGNSEKLTILGSFSCYFSIERILHSFLERHSVRGEWFERKVALLLLERFNAGTNYYSSKFVKDLELVQVQKLMQTGVTNDDGDEALEVSIARDLIDDWVHQLKRVNTEKSLPFSTWLLSKQNENSTTGDLATDVISDKNFPLTGNLRDYLEYMRQRQVSAAVTRTLIDAWIECDMAISSLLTRDQDVWGWEANS